MADPVRRIAILGAGVAGASLAFRLARAGIAVAVFDRMRRPPLIVGESMIPAIIPFLRDLGLEEEVADYSIFKPGATFVFSPEESLDVTFSEVRGARTTYAYNIPRGKLDASVAARAFDAGARHVEAHARLERVAESDRVRLAPDSLAAVEPLLGGPPDLIVDASGRARLISNLLDLPFDAGPRKDAALFAHCDGVPLRMPGNIHVDYLERGWSWRIPLPGRVSVGLVMDSGHLKRFGDTIDEQYDRYLAHDPMIRAWGPTPKRLTRVMKYNNYQLVTRRGVGDGWVLLGDAFGFIDPVFSSGTLLAFHSARELARVLVAGGGAARLARYEQRVTRHIRNWQRTVDHFYNGRLLTLFRVGELVHGTLLGRLIDPHMRKYLPRVFTGEGSAGRYSPALVDFMCRRGLLDLDPEELRVA